MSDSKPIKIYIDAMSQPSRSIHWICLLGNIPFEVKPIHIAKQQHKTEEYMKKHSFGKVPLLEDTENGLCIIESGAIANYLIRKYKLSGTKLFPNDETLQVRIDEFMHWYPANLRFYLTKLVFSSFLAPSRKIPVPEGTVEKAKKETESALDVLENFWLSRSKNGCIASESSIADIFCYGEVSELFVVQDFDVFKNRPKLKEWATKMEKLEGYDQVHKVLTIVRNKYNPTSKL